MHQHMGKLRSMQQLTMPAVCRLIGQSVNMYRLSEQAVRSFAGFLYKVRDGMPQTLSYRKFAKPEYCGVGSTDQGGRLMAATPHSMTSQCARALARAQGFQVACEAACRLRQFCNVDYRHECARLCPHWTPISRPER